MPELTVYAATLAIQAWRDSHNGDTPCVSVCEADMRSLGDDAGAAFDAADGQKFAQTAMGAQELWRDDTVPQGEMRLWCSGEWVEI